MHANQSYLLDVNPRLYWHPQTSKSWKIHCSVLSRVGTNTLCESDATQQRQHCGNRVILRRPGVTSHCAYKHTMSHSAQCPKQTARLAQLQPMPVCTENLMNYSAIGSVEYGHPPSARFILLDWHPNTCAPGTCFRSQLPQPFHSPRSYRNAV